MEMEPFAAVSKARDTYSAFADAMNRGRDILMRAGISAAPPPVPAFDAVFRRLDPAMKQDLYSELETLEAVTTPDAIRIWQPLLKRAFGQPR